MSITLKIKQKVKKILILFLEKFSNFTIVEKNLHHRHTSKLIPVFAKQAQLSLNDEIKIDSIVFSKDRAMQLHAFLSSYKEKTKNNEKGTMYILYKVSDERHKKSYDDLKNIFSKDNFIFVEEENFRAQLINILEASTARMFAFYVDDMIFIREVDFSVFLGLDPLENVISLSRGKDLDYSHVNDMPIDVPNLTKIFDNLYSFNWYNEKVQTNEWTYPTSVTAHIFGRREILTIIKYSHFKAPNSLERRMNNFTGMFRMRNGICLENVACICVHANLVQTEWTNNILGVFSIEDLLLKWEEGYAIDINKFYGIHARIAQFQNYEFMKR